MVPSKISRLPSLLGLCLSAAMLTACAGGPFMGASSSTGTRDTARSGSTGTGSSTSRMGAGSSGVGRTSSMEGYGGPDSPLGSGGAGTGGASR